MSFQKSAILLTSFILLILSACSTTETPINTANTNAVNANIARTNAENPLATQKTPEIKNTNEAATVAPIVKAFCDAVRTKNDAELQKVYSQASWKILLADAKEDNKKSVAEYLAESEPVGNNCGVRNENVQGSTAEALVTTETYPNGINMKFVMENNQWKLTNESSEFNSVKQASNNTVR